MCLPIDSWFCMSSTVNDDYHQPAPAGPPPAPAGRTTQLPAQRNGGGHYNGNGYPVHHAPAAAAEADRKASNDVRRGPAPTHAIPAGVQEKADGTLKQQPTAARNGMVAAAHGARGVAAHNYYYYEPAHREDAAAADFYHHHHPAATATADHERY
ncbi:uncharacterized protein [Miscanthus floridulus]|uniref:uncharacterized protein n=1 Tax=Miscanthus floridulus TaxID=154761 RepID=UPI0034598CB2